MRSSGNLCADPFEPGRIGDATKSERRLMRGDERAAAWQRIGADAPGYAAYERMTDREVPVVRLIRER